MPRGWEVTQRDLDKLKRDPMGNLWGSKGQVQAAAPELEQPIVLI